MTDCVLILVPRILNAEGRCYPFDDRGFGYGRGEGAAAVVVKRLGDAIKANDSIRAVIRGTAVGQDGWTKTLTLPNAEAQKDLIRSAYEAACLDPSETGYIEAHGTGTLAGDSAEIDAIRHSFCSVDHTKQRLDRILYVGSVKANIGHLESSSGLAGLIKSILILEKEIIPPMPNFDTAKKNLELKENHIEVRVP